MSKLYLETKKYNNANYIIIIGCPSILMKAVLSWISEVSFPPSFQVLLFSLSFNGVASMIFFLQKGRFLASLSHVSKSMSAAFK